MSQLYVTYVITLRTICDT